MNILDFWNHELVESLKGTGFTLSDVTAMFSHVSPS